MDTVAPAGTAGPALRPQHDSLPVARWRPFVVLAASAALFAAALTAWLGFGFGGPTLTNHASDVGEVIPALAAGLSCGWAATRARGRLRWAWALLGASATAWGFGEVAWSYYDIGLGVSVPFPSAADIGYLAAIPLSVGGVLAFPAAATRATTRARAALDGTTVALSLFFVSWALGLAQIYQQSSAGLLAQAIGVAYPVGDIVIMTVLFVAFRRSAPSQRGRLLLLMAGLAANAFSDSTFAFLTVNGTYAASNQLLNCGWIYGYLLIMLAPAWPERSHDTLLDEGAITVWRMMLPWFGLIAVVATAALLVATNRPLDPFLAFPGAALVAVLMVSQALAYRDSLSLVAISRRAEATVRERETTLKNVIDNAPQGVAQITFDGRIAAANPRLAAILASPVRTLLGQPLERLMGREATKNALGPFSSSSPPADGTFQEERQVSRADGSNTWLEWSLTPVRRIDGSIEFFMAMFDDITQKHEAQQTAEANLAQLESLNKMKSEFMSVVSHEFRTALVGIQGFSELIRDAELEEREVKEMADDINKDALRINRMLTEMLDLDRLEAGKIHLDPKPLDVNEVVLDAIERARVSSTKHQIVDYLEPNLPLVSADPDRLTEVLSNLLTNAIKYSPNGGEVDVTTCLSGINVQISVKDHGLGIPAEFLSRLFGRYERFENKGAAKIVGTGLGLAITRQIVELHGGKIWVESTVGSGSDFKFTIPVVPDTHNRPTRP